jgi:putative membrane protein
MNHLKRSLSKITAVASVLGVVACGGQPSQANTPSGGQKTAESTDQTGATMGQPNNTTTGIGETGGLAPAGAADHSASGETNAYGSQGTVGVGPGSASPGTTGSGGAASMSGESGTGVAGSGATDTSGLSDAQIAAVIQVINEGEIQQAQLAQSKAKSAEVKRFAQHMLAAHRDMENKDKKLLVRIQLVPSESAMSNQVKTDGQTQLSTLQGMTGQDFDRDYIEVQIRGHNQALELIDRMVPTAKSAELKTELQNARPLVEQHLREAERLQQDLQKASNQQRGVKQAQ